MAFCKNCGTQLREKARFCDNCGTQVVSKAPSPQTNKQAMPKKSRLGWLFLVTGMIIVIFIINLQNESNRTPQKSYTTKSINTNDHLKDQIEPASQQQLERIELAQKQGNYIKMKGFTIKSPYHNSAYYVSTKIYGPGMENGVVGVWIMNGEKNSPKLVISVDGYAHNFTPTLPYAPETKVDASITDPAARILKRYTEQNL